MASLFKNLFGDNRPLNLNPEGATAEVEPIYRRPVQSKPKFTVQDIHNDFNSAADTIIKEALREINEPLTPEMDKAIRLKKLGFNAAEPVRKMDTEIKKTEQEAESLKQIKLEAEAAIYFKQKYPFYKFITIRKVESLCNKYGLECQPISRYKGDVPEKNLKEIELFKVAPEDTVVTITYHKSGSGYPWAQYYINKLAADNLETKINGYGKSYLVNPRYDSDYIDNADYYRNNNISIVAPPYDFLQRNEQVVNGSIVEVKDPIVLHPVFYEGLCESGIYLIITAWGDEASDPDVMNEHYN